MAKLSQLLLVIRRWNILRVTHKIRAIKKKKDRGDPFRRAYKMAEEEQKKWTFCKFTYHAVDLDELLDQSYK